MSQNANILKFRQICLKRGASGIKGIGRQFRVIDDDGSKSLSCEEFEAGLADFGVVVSAEEAKEMFNAFDTDRSGSLNFTEFLAKLRPPMSKSRLDLVDMAFKKFDKTGDGVITAADMKGTYNARKHPKYQNGELTEKEVFQVFLNNFEPDPKYRDGQVTHEEFLNYYAGVSSNIDDDTYFDLMMRNSWKL